MLYIIYYILYFIYYILYILYIIYNLYIIYIIYIIYYILYIPPTALAIGGSRYCFYTGERVLETDFRGSALSPPVASR